MKTAEEKEIAKMRKAGFIPANSHVEITEPATPPFEPGSFPFVPGQGPPPPVAVAPPAAAPYDPEADAAWLKTLPLYRSLAGKPRQRFAAEAVAFRAVTAARLRFVEEIRPLTDACRKAGAGQDSPWMSRLKRFLTLDGPERWRPCDECHGAGEADLFGPCQKCRGNGYTI